jgi:hypothetical protein
MTRTFGALADRYLKEHARRFKKTAEADERALTVHILPKWGARPYHSIGRRDVIELCEGIVATGKPTDRVVISPIDRQPSAFSAPGRARPRQAGVRANILFIFQAMVTRFHSPRALSSPRNEN